MFERVVRYFNRRSLYPMVINSWADLETPEVLQSVIDAGYFRKFLRPTQPDLTHFKHVCVIAPHQDDEAIGCGGLLVALKDSVEITVVFLTNGAQTSLGIDEDQSVRLRDEEAARALQFCGARRINLGLPNNELSPTEPFVQKLEVALADLTPKPDLILAPWLFDRPFKHRICNALLLESLDRLPSLQNVPLWGYQVHNCLFPNVVVDISDQIEAKQSMIRCYSSQIDQVARYDHFITGMNQWNAQYLSAKSSRFAEIFYGDQASQALKSTPKLPYARSARSKAA